MALTGQGSVNVSRKEFDIDDGGWPPNFETGAYIFFAGQGYQYPADELWINKPTGEEIPDTGNVYAFPRSAEGEPGPPPGAGGWQVKEC